MTESHLAAGRVVDLGEILGHLVHVEEGGDGSGFLGFLVDHQRHADAAVGMASAGELAPLGAGPVNEVGPVREGAHEADGEPVALGLAEADLVFDVVRHVREGVALGHAALVGDVFVAAGEADRLEAEEADLLGIVEGELDDAADLLVVDAVDDGGDGNDFNAGFVQVVDGLELHVEEVADLAVRVGRVADAVELEVDVAEAGFGGGAAKLLATWRTRCRWRRPAPSCSQPCASRRRRRGSRARAWARRRRTGRSSAAWA